MSDGIKPSVWSTWSCSHVSLASLSLASTTSWAPGWSETSQKGWIVTEKLIKRRNSRLIRPHHLLSVSFRGQDNLWGSLQLLRPLNCDVSFCSHRKSPAAAADNENNRMDMLRQTFANTHCTNPAWPSPSSFPPSDTPHCYSYKCRIVSASQTVVKKRCSRIQLWRCWNGAKAQRINKSLKLLLQPQASRLKAAEHSNLPLVGLARLFHYRFIFPSLVNTWFLNSNTASWAKMSVMYAV